MIHGLWGYSSFKNGCDYQVLLLEWRSTVGLADDQGYLKETGYGSSYNIMALYRVSQYLPYFGSVIRIYYIDLFYHSYIK